MDARERWERGDHPPWALREGSATDSAVAALGDKPAGPPSLWRVLSLLVLLDVGLHTLYFVVPDRFVLYTLHYWGLTRPCAALIGWLAPDAGLTAQQGGLVGPGVNLSILRGCDGVGMMFLLIAAVVAVALAARRWRAAACGLAAAAAVSYALNLARIVALYFVAAHRPAWFDTAHNLVLPLGVVMVSGLFFAGWSNLMAAALPGPQPA